MCKPTAASDDLHNILVEMGKWEQLNRVTVSELMSSLSQQNQ